MPVVSVETMDNMFEAELAKSRMNRKYSRGLGNRVFKASQTNRLEVVYCNLRFFFT